LRPNPDGFAPEVRAEMEKLFWWGIRALLSLTTGGPEEAYAEGAL
jgi:putative NADPH-quinone reductase